MNSFQNLTLSTSIGYHYSWIAKELKNNDCKDDSSKMIFNYLHELVLFFFLFSFLKPIQKKLAGDQKINQKYFLDRMLY